MEHRVLGGSGLAISAVGLGGVELCGGDATRGEPTLDEATVVVETAIDAGVNWIDTAESYHETRNEAFIGDVLRRVGARLLVSTKLAPSPGGSGFRRDEVHAACRASLTRLGREQIDVYLLHYPDDTGVPLEETWEAMTELVDAGLVRAIGLSNYETNAVERCNAQRPADVVQDGLSLVDHLDNRESIARCGELGIGVVVYEPLGSGTLSGRSIDEVRRAWADWSEFGFYKRLLAGENGIRSAAMVDALCPIAERNEVSIPQLAIAWVLRQQGVRSTLAGSRKPEHVKQNAQAADLDLPESVFAHLETLIPLGPTVARTD